MLNQNQRELAKDGISDLRQKIEKSRMHTENLTQDCCAISAE